MSMLNIAKLPIWNEVIIDTLPPDVSVEKPELIILEGKIFMFYQSKKETHIYCFDTIHNKLTKINGAETRVFRPITDDNGRIFMFSLAQQSMLSDNRYSIIMFSLETETFVRLYANGIPPKERDNFQAFYHDDTIYFMGGTPKDASDLLGSMIYTLDLKSMEWHAMDPLAKEYSELSHSHRQRLLLGNCQAIYNEEGVFFLRDNITKKVSKQSANGQGVNMNDLEEFARYDICSKRVDRINFSNENDLNISKLYKITHQGDVIYIADYPNFYRIDLSINEIRRINKGIFLKEFNSRDFAFCVDDRMFYILTRTPENQIILFFINEFDLKDLKWTEKNSELTEYFNKAAYSDLIFRFDKVDIFCNKALLSRYCKNFAKVFADNEISIMKIPDIDYQIFSLMMEIIYSTQHCMIPRFCMNYLSSPIDLESRRCRVCARRRSILQITILCHYSSWSSMCIRLSFAKDASIMSLITTRDLWTGGRSLYWI
eukprot:TRINITY_DN7431_c0_g1_i3.p1 TRINITY_DN7431_c0_g1~~TRINITY_DN7431_c0_g1_i3.p1  ORF type:complete len:486 (-),score=67.74 TRINITY_DN7431_c0_g1_i3:475-1932(-)